MPVDPNVQKNQGQFEVVYDLEDGFDCYMIKVDIKYGYYSGNTFYKM